MATTICSKSITIPSAKLELLVTMGTSLIIMTIGKHTEWESEEMSCKWQYSNRDKECRGKKKMFIIAAPFTEMEVKKLQSKFIIRLGDDLASFLDDQICLFKLKSF